MQKSRSLEQILELKTSKVLDIHKKRQIELKQKNEMALARVRANESKIFEEREKSVTEKQKVSTSYRV